MPRNTQDEELRQALEELRASSAGLMDELPSDIEAAIQAIEEDGSREFFTIHALDVSEEQLAVESMATNRRLSPFVRIVFRVAASLSAFLSFRPFVY